MFSGRKGSILSIFGHFWGCFLGTFNNFVFFSTNLPTKIDFLALPRFFDLFDTYKPYPGSIFNHIYRFWGRFSINFGGYIFLIENFIIFGQILSFFWLNFIIFWLNFIIFWLNFIEIFSKFYRNFWKFYRNFW